MEKNKPRSMKRKKQELEFFTLTSESQPVIPMAEIAVHAGFPCPVDDAYMSQPIDLNKELIAHPASSYIVRVTGNSMIEEGIDEGDILVVDRSLLPTERHISVVMYDGEFALKRIIQRDGKVILMPGNPEYPPIEVAEGSDLRVFGVVAWVMKRKA